MQNVYEEFWRVLYQSDCIVSACAALLREHNAKATIITTPWEELEGMDILNTIEGAKDLEAELMKEVMARRDEHEHHHEHHHDDEHEHHHHEDHEHHHEHHHKHHHEDHEHHHHHDSGHGHHHDEEHSGHEHHHEEHEHHHDEEHSGHDHHDGHEHHHHADEIFTSWGIETPLSYTRDEIAERLKKLEQEEEYGIVLRAKGMVAAGDGTWVYFDYVPEECDIRAGKPDVTGKICVIGSKLKEEKLEALFQK